MMMISSDPNVAHKIADARKQRSLGFYQVFKRVSFAARPTKVWTLLTQLESQITQAYRRLAAALAPKPCENC